MLKPVSITFDLDGTLVDTAPDLIRVLNETIALDGLAPVNIASARNLIGYGSMALIKRAFENARKPLTETHAKELQEFFLTAYADNIAQHSKPFPRRS